MGSVLMGFVLRPEVLIVYSTDVPCPLPDSERDSFFFNEKLLMLAEPKPQSCVGLLCLLTYPATQNQRQWNGN